MSPFCPHPAAIVRRARSGAPTASDREHLAGCPACRQALRLAQALAALEAPEGAPAAPPPLRSASQVYQRAELRRRWEESERARERAERVAHVGSAVGLSATLACLSFAALLTSISLPSGGVGLGAALTLSGAAGIALLLACGWALREA